jgi:hypothetical protein
MNKQAVVLSHEYVWSRAVGIKMTVNISLALLPFFFGGGGGGTAPGAHFVGGLVSSVSQEVLVMTTVFTFGGDRT